MQPDVDSSSFRLTEFSKGAGCGCKISPKALHEIINESIVSPEGDLLVGNSAGDDAAVVDLKNGTVLISSTDFFMPVVDDAFSFGKIAAANAISDIYAMGGKPLVAVAILGWPETIPPSEARKVMAGGREICKAAGIALAGGHSIESTEPFFGLAVNGLIQIENLKKNDTAKAGDFIFLTKPIGIGILSTAQKRKAITEEDASFMIDELSKLNTIGMSLGEIKEVTAMTDVTGFGIAGHLSEMAAGSGLTAEINYQQVPIYEKSKEYLKQRIVPDATYRNWNSYGDKISIEKSIDFMEAFSLLPDPQTNGGLLFSVKPEGIEKVKSLLIENGLKDFSNPIGHFIEKQEKLILVK